MNIIFNNGTVLVHECNGEVTLCVSHRGRTYSERINVREGASAILCPFPFDTPEIPTAMAAVLSWLHRQSAGPVGEQTPKITAWPSQRISGAKRANVVLFEEPIYSDDWWVGHGKEEGCLFEGTWWDMVCFARNVLSSENTKLAAPEFYHPEMKNDNYTGPTPYEYTPEPEGGV